MRDRSEAIAFEKKLGDWPRRLLKVEESSLVSYEWTEGNVYGGIERPTYAAVSYTWGRFELPHNSHNSQPDVESLDIRDGNGSPVPWSVPRINPDKGFKVDEMLAVLYSITGIQPKRSTSLDDKNATKVDLSDLPEFSHEQHVQFVWLDMGCIDQRESSPEKMLEIGRQAAIFRGAVQAYVWLYHHPASTFKSLLLSLYESWSIGRSLPSLGNQHMARGPLHATEINWLANTLKDLRMLNTDPYFSSLWTLQEAFLCSEARILTRDASLFHRHLIIPAYSSHGEDMEHNDLVTIEGLGRVMRELESQVILNRQYQGLGLDPSTWTAPERDLVNLVKVLGLTTCNTNNAIELYGITRDRVTSHRQDMIYAIQQIFEIRVGSSAAGPVLKTTFTNDELEQDFGRQLLEKYPFQSMFFIHEDEVAFGKRWYLSRWSKVPGPVLFNTRLSSRALLCKISMQAEDLRNPSLLKFRGRMCSLWRLARSWDRVGDVMRNFPVEYNENILAVPIGEEWDSPWLVSFDRNRGVGGFSGLENPVRCFEQHYIQDETLSVLHLARADHQVLTTHGSWWNIGLILKPRHCPEKDQVVEQYERIGITVWRSGIKLDEREMAASPRKLSLVEIIALHSGRGQSWDIKSGFMG